jgi:hypothetical protein
MREKRENNNNKPIVDREYWFLYSTSYINKHAHVEKGQNLHPHYMFIYVVFQPTSPTLSQTSTFLASPFLLLHPLLRQPPDHVVSLPV